MKKPLKTLQYSIRKCTCCGLDQPIRKASFFCDGCKTSQLEIRRLKRLEYTRRYRLTPEYRKKRNAQVREKLKNNPNQLLAKRIRSRIYLFIKKRGLFKIYSTQKILGCDYYTFRKHIESLFSEGMGWHNTRKWHLDHKIPLERAKTSEDVVKLNHYKNLQPMWAIDNLRKGTK